MVRGRPWIFAYDVLAGATPGVALFERLGAAGVFVLSGTTGSGPPPPDTVPRHLIGSSGQSVMQVIRHYEQALRTLPEDARAALDRFDPSGEARVIPALFSDGQPVGGRAVYGARPETWQALENKVEIDAL